MQRFGAAIRNVLTTITVALVVGCNFQPDAQGGSQGDTAPADLLFEQDGNRYAVVAGGLYEIRGDGSRKFVDNLYDPRFRANNYTVTDGKVFQKEPETGKLYPVTRNFREGFENASTVRDLMALDRWHRYNTDPEQAGKPDNFYNLGNEITISRKVVHGGSTAARFHARPDSRNVSKSALAKNLLYFEKGDDFYFSGWFFIEETPSISDAGAFTLLDLESSFLRYVGMRIIFRRNDSLAFELKMPKIQFEQESGSEVRFPVGQWVHVKAHLLLDNQDGLVEIWQDGRKVLAKRGPTLPLADTIYDNLELGITVIAKGSRYEKVLYVDDVEVSDSPIGD